MIPICDTEFGNWWHLSIELMYFSHKISFTLEGSLWLCLKLDKKYWPSHYYRKWMNVQWDFLIFAVFDCTKQVILYMYDKRFLYNKTVQLLHVVSGGSAIIWYLYHWWYWSSSRHTAGKGQMINTCIMHNQQVFSIMLQIITFGTKIKKWCKKYRRVKNLVSCLLQFSLPIYAIGNGFITNNTIGFIRYNVMLGTPRTNNTMV